MTLGFNQLISNGGECLGNFLPLTLNLSALTNLRPILSFARQTNEVMLNKRKCCFQVTLMLPAEFSKMKI